MHTHPLTQNGEPLLRHSWKINPITTTLQATGPWSLYGRQDLMLGCCEARMDVRAPWGEDSKAHQAPTTFLAFLLCPACPDCTHCFLLPILPAPATQPQRLGP